MFRQLTLAALTGGLLLLFAGCAENVTSTRSGSSGQPSVDGDWLIPDNLVFDGGPGRDGIPALSNPKMTTASQATYLTAGDLVIGVKIGEAVQAYPHDILDWHEIINDQILGTAFSITYCPLTGSGIGWNSTVTGEPTTFGVSGLLYNTNLIPYDRKTGSNWSQMRLQCVNGPLIGQYAELIRVIETSWETWQEMYPHTAVVSTVTGYSRNYGTYPYGDYRTNDARLLFPITNDDSRLPRKDRVLGVILGGATRVYPMNRFPGDVVTINDTVGGVPVVIAGSGAKNFAVAYERGLGDGTVLEFEPVQDALPIVMRAQDGTSYDVFGVAQSGPRAGTTLPKTRSFISYWFAWGAFYPGAAIYGG